MDSRALNVANAGCRCNSRYGEPFGHTGVVMDIYLLRHGRAGESDSSDAARQLTEDGVERLRKVLRGARNARASPTQLFWSPLARAGESAEIAAEVLGCRDSVERVDWLQPDSGPEQVLEELGRLGRGQNQAGNDASFLLVGHEPVLGAAVARLLGSTQD